MFEQELECCGAEFEKKHISLIGLLSLSLPLLLICLVLKILLLPLSFFLEMRIVNLLITANFKLIKQKNILSRYKCQLASSLFIISPRFSGFIFKYFNLSVLLLIWILFIMTIYQMASL